LELNTTVEDVLKVKHPLNNGSNQWKLTLRKYDALQDADVWWEETFDAVVLANGHYSVPTVSDSYRQLARLDADQLRFQTSRA